MKGWKIVPEEPTDIMLARASKASLSTSVLMSDERFACERAYHKVMLETAPACPGKIISNEMIDLVLAELVSANDNVYSEQTRAVLKKFREDMGRPE